MEIAVLIPCYNEELTIGDVIDDFRKSLPEATIYVYDNNSSDRTYEIAKQKGAIVRREYRQGKGNVVRSMFREIEADYYIMVDGDNTYPAEFAKKLLEPLLAGRADMTIGDRLSNGSYKSENKRAFHNFGNIIVKRMIGFLFKNEINDIMTGYRGFNRLFVKTMPVLSKGFEIETEMSIHALDKNFLIEEMPIDYRDRPAGSESKLNTYKDGIKVIATVVSLFKDYKPLRFFSIISLILILLGLALGGPIFYEFFRYRSVTRLPTAILASEFIMIAIGLILVGFVLDTLVKQNRQSYELYINETKEKEQDLKHE